jgi:hypothetical protein
MVSRFLLLWVFVSSCFAAEVAGVKLPDEDQKLTLNGAGLRKRAFFNVYVIGLYLPEKKTAAADIVNAPGDGMKDNLSEADMKRLEPQISELSGTMSRIKVAKTGMRITLDWLPGKGTQVTVEGKPTGAVIPGEDFYRGILRIWLGDNPVQADLKKALLGG